MKNLSKKWKRKKLILCLSNMSLAKTNPELTTEQKDSQEDIKYMEEKLPDAHWDKCNGCAFCEADL